MAPEKMYVISPLSVSIINLTSSPGLIPTDLTKSEGIVTAKEFPVLIIFWVIFLSDRKRLFNKLFFVSDYHYFTVS